MPPRSPRPPRPRVLPELVIGLATLVVYLVIESRGGPGRQFAARENGEWLYRAERWLHLDVELSVNLWLDRHGLLRALAGYGYATTYLLAAAGLLFWLWLRRPEEYRRARTSFVLLNLLAFLCFWLYPVMPPRLLPAHGFIDTVTAGRSWGTPLFERANQLAAMPSLHVAWALWVSAVLARLAARRSVQVISAVHVVVTVGVVVATANHFLLDVAGAGGLVLIAVQLPYRLPLTGERVPAADAFFLHVESPSWPQQAGAVVPLAAEPSRERVIEVVRAELGELPRFRQVLHEHRWAPPRRQDAADLDWRWHVPLIDLRRPDGRPGGQRALDTLVASLADTELPRDRPLWRLVVVHGVEEGRGAVVLIAHRVITDGPGTIGQVLHLLRPVVPDPFGDKNVHHDGRSRRTVSGVAGLGRLVADGRAPRLWPEPDDDLVPPPVGRAFRRFRVPLDDVRELARARRARVSDVLLCAVAGALARLDLPDAPDRFRVAVPLTVHPAEGAATTAALLDLPIGRMPESERLRLISRLRSPDRARATHWVLSAAGALLPLPAHRWFARTVYGRRSFHGVVANRPGPAARLSLAGADVEAAHPLLPLAPDTALAVGTLGWDGTLCTSVTTGGPLLARTDELMAGIRATLAELGLPVPAEPAPDHGVPVRRVRVLGAADESHNRSHG